jgi:site-specific DNA-methyltransferase (adenine-specific)
MANILYKGDCLIEMDKIADKSVDMILCDLPYGTTACKWDSVLPFDKLWEQYERIIKPNGAIVLTASQPFTSALIMSNPILFKYCWIWQKSKVGNIFNCKNAPQKNYEDIAVFSKASIANGSKVLMKYNSQGLIKVEKTRSNISKGRKDTTIGIRPSRLDNEYIQEFTNYPKQILQFNNEQGSHPTQKPVALFEYLIKTYTNEGDTVLDNCMGSGTTGVACKKTGRHFIGIEKDPAYYEMAVKRITNHSPQLTKMIHE